MHAVGSADGEPSTGGPLREAPGVSSPRGYRMLIYFSVPLLDFRGLSRGDPRLDVPEWATPAEWRWDSDTASREPGFLRGFGSVEGRRLGGPYGWPREDAYVNARRGVVVRTWDGRKRHNISLRCIFRRVFFDGHAIARLDVGLAAAHVEEFADHQALLAAGLVNVLRTPTKVRNTAKSARISPLWRVGPSVAAAYQAATEPYTRVLPTSMVHACQPIVIIETDVPFSHQSRVWIGEDRGLSLHPGKIMVRSGTSLPAWLVSVEENLMWRDRRMLRISLIRQHAERMALLETLSALESGTMCEDRDENNLLRFVEMRLRSLTKGSLYSFPQEQIAEYAWRATSMQSGESWATTLDRIAVLGPSYEKLVAKTTNMGSTTGLDWQFVYIDKRTIMAERMKIISLGSNNTVSAPIVVADKIQDSFNAASSVENDQVREALEELHQVITPWLASLEPRTAEDVATDLEALTNEAKRTEARSARIQVFWSSIKSVAESVAQNAGPVLGALAAVSKVFGFG